MQHYACTMLGCISVLLLDSVDANWGPELGGAWRNDPAHYTDHLEHGMELVAVLNVVAFDVELNWHKAASELVV